MFTKEQLARRILAIAALAKEQFIEDTWIDPGEICAEAGVESIEQIEDWQGYPKELPLAFAANDDECRNQIRTLTLEMIESVGQSYAKMTDLMLLLGLLGRAQGVERAAQTALAAWAQFDRKQELKAIDILNALLSEPALFQAFFNQLRCLFEQRS